MFGLVGYNFNLDKNAIDPTLTNLNNLTNVQLQNGIFDHFTVTRDITSPYSSSIPTEWDFFTIMNAGFNGNINAGNTDFIITEISAIKIKRRIVGTFDWLTLFEFPINSTADLKLAVKDFYNVNDEDYEYAIVPIMSSVEGNYLTNEVHSEFDGVFICDKDDIFKFYEGVQYGTKESVQKIGVYEPIGNKYPIVVSNASTDYEAGSITATILDPTYSTTRQINRKKGVDYQNILNVFLKNKKAKIIKDWNGNIYLVKVIGNPSTSYRNDIGMGVVDLSFNWVEQGDPNLQSSLYANGLVKVIE